MGRGLLLATLVLLSLGAGAGFGLGVRRAGEPWRRGVATRRAEAGVCWARKRKAKAEEPEEEPEEEAPVAAADEEVVEEDPDEWMREGRSLVTVDVENLHVKPDNSEAFTVSHDGMVKTYYVSRITPHEVWEEDMDMAYILLQASDFPTPFHEPDHRGAVVLVTTDSEPDKTAALEIIDAIHERFGKRVQIVHHRFDALPVDPKGRFPETLPNLDRWFEIYFQGWDGAMLYSRKNQGEEGRYPTGEEVEAMIEDVDGWTSDLAYKHVSADRVPGI